MSYPIVARRLELGDFAGARTSVDEIFADIRSKIGVGLDEREISEVLAGADRLQRLGVIAMLETSGAAAALDFYDGARAQALAASMRMDLLDLSEEDRVKLSNLRVQIAEDTLRLEAAPQRTRMDIDALAKLRREAEVLVVKGGKVPPERSDIVTVAPIASQLGVHLFVRTTDGATLSVLVPELPINLLGKYAEDWVRTQREAVDTKTVSRGLHATDLSLRPLTDAIRTLLDQAGVQSGAQVALMPDGAMGSLPLQLLSGSAGRPLVDDYEIVVTPSLANFALARQRAATPQGASLIAFANPSGDPALPFSSIEVDLLAKSFAGFDVRILRDGPTAVSEAAAALFALRGREYWHFSTHGEFDWADPNNSSLFLARGGRLRVGEIKIGAGALGTPRLVVLAACETGLADAKRAPNEFNGLPIAFLQAGAAGVIASSWTVSDLSSAVLIAKMYELHLGPAHLRASSALRQAQQWLRHADRHQLEEFLESRQDDLSFDQFEWLMRFSRFARRASICRPLPLGRVVLLWRLSPRLADSGCQAINGRDGKGCHDQVGLLHTCRCVCCIGRRPWLTRKRQRNERRHPALR